MRRKYPKRSLYWLMKNLYVFPVVMVLSAIVPVWDMPLIGSDLAQFSILAGGYATYGAGAVASGKVGALDYIVGGAGAASAGDDTNTTGVNNALLQLGAAQRALNFMQTTSILAPTVSGFIELAPGVYSASALTTAAGTTLHLDGGGLENPVWVFNIPTYLVTGASTSISIINAGANASVIWNTGGYVSMGASTSFLGTILSGAYISQGAGSDFSCGNLFASSYVSLSAGSQVTSTACKETDSWAGSLQGLGANLDIADGIAVAHIVIDDPTSAVPEPKTTFLIGLGFGLLGLFRMQRKVPSA